MSSRERQHLQPILCVLLAILLHPGATESNEHLSDALDGNECTGSDTYLCGCQAVPATEMPHVKELLHQDPQCEQLCAQQTCEQICGTVACSYPMGSRGEFCTTTVLDQWMVNYIRASTCVYNEEMMVHECVKGDSVAYPDVHTFEAIVDGYCIPTCDLDISLFQCTFEPRFREETDVKPEDRENPPYTTIVGVEVPEVPKTPTPPPSEPEPEPEAPEPAELEEPTSPPMPPPFSKPSETPVETPAEPPVTVAEPETVPAPELEAEAPKSPAPEPEEEPEEAPEPAPEPAEIPKEEPLKMPAPEPEEEPEEAPEPEEEPEEAPEPEEEPVMAPLNNNTLYYSDFGECSQVCAQAGDSYRERFITCRNPAGVPVELNQCTLPDDLSESYFTTCQTEECGPDYYVVLFDWSSCEGTCSPVMADGVVIPNRISRGYECRRLSDDSQVDASECEDLLEELEVVLTTPCNSVPCNRYGYSTSEWSSCDCETWNQTRTTTCVQLSSGEEVDVSICETFGIVSPATEQVCYPDSCFENVPPRKLLQTELDICDFTQCSTMGECTAGGCDCQRGFEGPDCQMDTRRDSECPVPSLLDAEGECCSSGVFDPNGQCCNGLNSEAEIDIEGNCCIGSPLDACGQCSGDVPNVLDSAGQCCLAMDAAGVCCPSGQVDECGVCDGFGKTCNTTISFTVRIVQGQEVDACVSELLSLVENALRIASEDLTIDSQTSDLIAFSQIDQQMTSGFITNKVQEELQSQEFVSCNVRGMSSAKLPICGNRICEINEAENCPNDCDDSSIQMCEIQIGLYDQPVLCNGHGSCSISDGECSCFPGYEGENCESCTNGFFHVEDDSRCIAGQVFSERPQSLVATRPVVPVTPVTESPVFTTSSRIEDPPSAIRNSDGHTIYWPFVLVGVVLFLTVVLTLIFIIVRRRRTNEEKQSEDPRQVALNEIASTPDARAREHDAMWDEFTRDIAPAATLNRSEANQNQEPSA